MKVKDELLKTSVRRERSRMASLLGSVAVCGGMLLLCNASSRLAAFARSSGLRTVTLFSQIKYNDFGKASFNFEYGLRGDVGTELTHNEQHIAFGGISLNGYINWLTIPGYPDWSARIKDLGPMEWSGLGAVPVLPVKEEPRRGIRFPKLGESLEQSSDGQVSEALPGHMYLLHTKDRGRNGVDFYVLFRVERLADDTCTISWKVVPSPEGTAPG